MLTKQCDLERRAAASKLAWKIETMMLTFPAGNESIALIL